MGGGHHGGHHHGGGGGRFFRGGGMPYPVFYGGGYPYPIIDEPRYVPVFIVPDEEDLERERKKKKTRKKDDVHGLGIFTPHNKMALALGSALGVVFGNTTADAKVTETQKWLNGYLSKLGFTLLTVDGKLGAKTCGACAWAFGNTPDVDISTAPASFFEVWQVCSTSSQTMPTALTAAAKTSAYSTGVQAMQMIPNTSIIKEVQGILNTALKAHGMCPIAVDGQAGPATCGAQVWLIANAGGDGLTQDQRNSIYPTCSVVDKVAPSICAEASVVPTVVAAQAAPAVAPVIPVEAPLPSAPAKVNKAGMVMGLGLMGALGAAVYYFTHRG
jgi:hypothetical protein